MGKGGDERRCRSFGRKSNARHSRKSLSPFFSFVWRFSPSLSLPIDRRVLHSYIRHQEQHPNEVRRVQGGSHPSLRSIFHLLSFPVTVSQNKDHPPFPPPSLCVSISIHSGWIILFAQSMETVLTMALAMGRVLVLPPSQKMYLLGSATFDFADFFPLREVAAEHAGLDVITMEEFLIETNGRRWKDPSSTGGGTAYSPLPPHNRTDWNGDTAAVRADLNPWLRSVSYDPALWDPTKCIAAFPQSTSQSDVDLLERAMAEILAEGGGDDHNKATYHERFINRPTPVDSPLKERLAEFLAGRSRLCVYDADMQKAPLIHFHGRAKQETGGRLLVHFYAFLFFQDWRADLWIKRFVRDHVRYVDAVQCAAARVVRAVRATAAAEAEAQVAPGGGGGGVAKTENGGHPDGTYDSMHIRRGDFQVSYLFERGVGLRTSIQMATCMFLPSWIVGVHLCKHPHTATTIPSSPPPPDRPHKLPE